MTAVAIPPVQNHDAQQQHNVPSPTAPGMGKVANSPDVYSPTTKSCRVAKGCFFLECLRSKKMEDVVAKKTVAVLDLDGTVVPRNGLPSLIAVVAVTAACPFGGVPWVIVALAWIVAMLVPVHLV